MKNLENAKALNDMEMAMVAGGLGPWIDYMTRSTGCFLEIHSKAPSEEAFTRLKKPGA